MEYAQPWLYSFGTLLLQRRSYVRGVRLAAAAPLDNPHPVEFLQNRISAALLPVGIFSFGLLRGIHWTAAGERFGKIKELW